MKILLVNKFLYPRGGDAISTLNAGKVLEGHGHEVFFWGMECPENPSYPFNEYFVSNVDYDGTNSVLGRIKAATNILYSLEARKKIAALLDKIKPDVVHLNNFAHQISPSILDEIKKHRIPTIMTMHDYKLICPAYSMLCGGEVCERCGERLWYQCGINRCTKGSLLKSYLNVAEMYLHHRILHIYDNIHLYISPSRFLRNKVLEMGLKGEVVHLPNCVSVSRFEPAFQSNENVIVYVGRLSHEKGVETLIHAVRGIPEVQLKVIGDGPLRAYLEEKVHDNRVGNVVFCGYQSGTVLHNEIRNSMFLVIPSEWYENNPLTVIEAFALGKPVVGARIGGIPELVQDWKTGLTHTAGDVNDLRNKILLMLKNKHKIPEMGRNARSYVERELNSEVHYGKLMGIYQQAAAKAGKSLEC